MSEIGTIVLTFAGAFGVAKLLGKRSPLKIATVTAVAVAVLLVLSGCSGDGNQSLRATAAALDGNALPAQQATPQPPAEVVRDVVQTVVVEATRIVPDVRTVVQTVVVPVEVVVTATPDIQGFPAEDAAGFMNAPAVIDESVQPCPVDYWVNGQCTATQAEIDAYAEGGN